jgi:hypothetical protein
MLTSDPGVSALIQIVAASILVAGSGVGLAQTDSQRPADPERTAAARALFNEGLQHLDAARWTDAADRFERAYVLRASPEIAYNLTSALVRMGKLVRASELLRDVVQNAQASRKVRDAAAARLAQIGPRIARLTVRTTGPDADLAVTLDGRTLEPALLGVAIPVDPGAHTVAATHGGTPVFERALTVADGGSEEILIEESAPAAAKPPAAGDAGVENADAGLDAASPVAEPTPLPAVPAAALEADGSPPARPLLHRWWLWTAVGAVVLGAGLALLVSQRNGTKPEEGNVGTLHVGR